jgi:hypothetical protein
MEAQKHADQGPQHCIKEFKRIGPPQRYIFKRRINILETTMKKRHLKISLAVYSSEREETARSLPISKEYSSGTSTYPHLKAIPIGYSLKILLRSCGPVRYPKAGIGITVYSITDSPKPLCPILIILAGSGSALADLDPVSYLSSSCHHMNLNGKYGDFIVKLMVFGSKNQG